MTGRIALLALCFFVSVASASESHAASVDDAAVAFVAKRNLGSNLSSLGFATATRTQTFRAIASTTSDSEARALVKRELDRIAPKYQERWNKNLALAYAESFSAAELVSLANEGQSSTYAAKFASKQGEVGQAMQARSTPILKEFVTEGLAAAFAKSVPAK